MKKLLLSVSLVCFLFVPLAMAGTALINSDEDQNFDGYTSSWVDGSTNDSDYHSWSGSDGENHTEIGSSNAGGTAKVWGYFYEGQASNSWVRMEFDPSTNATQTAYATLDRSFECNAASEAGDYTVLASVLIRLEVSTANEFDGYLEFEDMRIDWTGDITSGIVWDRDNGASSGAESLTIKNGMYEAEVGFYVSSDIQLNETHNATIYVNGSGENGDDSEAFVSYILTPLP